MGHRTFFPEAVLAITIIMGILARLQPGGKEREDSGGIVGKGNP
jgi:hypothetical protein